MFAHASPPEGGTPCKHARFSSIHSVIRITLFLLPIANSFQARSDSVSPIAVSGPTMGTTFSVKWLADSKTPDAQAIHQDITATLARIEVRMSTYRADSEVSRFNAHQGTNWFDVSSETANLAHDAQAISKATQGAFDITVYPLVELWGFGPKRGLSKAPSSAEITAARARVGYQHLEVRTNSPALRKLIPNLAIDLSGIAKGYGVDAIAARMDALGVRNYLVSIAGELKARGHSADGKPWRVGIDRPDATASAIDHVIELRDAAISTSGTYRNFHEVGNRRYAHIIDPKTGWPVANGLASVSVLHASSARADAFATALMVQGMTNGLATARTLKFEALFVQRDEARWITQETPGFKSVRSPQQ